MSYVIVTHDVTCEVSVTGSGVYIGVLWCLMYWVEWNTRKARPARKSREERRPATGRSWNPVTPGDGSPVRHQQTNDTMSYTF